MSCNCISPDCQCYKLADLRPAFSSGAERERFHRETQAARENREFMHWYMSEQARSAELDRREP